MSNDNNELNVEDVVEPKEDDSVETNTEAEIAEEEDAPVTMEEIERLSKVIQAEATKNQYEDTLNELKSQQDQLLDNIKGLSEDKDIIHNRLKGWKLEDLKKYIYASQKNTNEFFLDESTGEQYELNVNTKDAAAELEFKRGFLIYLKTTDDTWDKIDEEYRKLDEATAEFNANIHEVTYRLSDNILTYIGYMKDRANALPDGKEKRELLKAVRYEESGYTMDIYKENYLKYPTAITNCKSDLKSPRRVSELGERYMTHLQRTNTRISLIPFASDEGKTEPFEKIVLLEDQYEIPDLFVFSLIRHFAMSDWNDPNTKRAHAVICLVIKRLIGNDFSDQEVKTNVINAIVDYLSIFK